MSTYDENNECRSCGEHLAAPHAADCPRGNAADLRTWAEAALDEGDAVAYHQAIGAAALFEADADHRIVLADFPQCVDAVNTALRAAGLIRALG